MVDRYGNYLVQGCLRNGTEEQKIKIAHTIYGYVVQLSMDTFGCHVIQAALDVVTDNSWFIERAWIVHELLQAIPISLFHPYANHVWRKLLGLSIEEVVAGLNRELYGKWHRVALHESGFYIIQAILMTSYPEEHKVCGST
jgi:pumilio RNA-binding family